MRLVFVLRLKKPFDINTFVEAADSDDDEDVDEDEIDETLSGQHFALVVAIRTFDVLCEKNTAFYY